MYCRPRISFCIFGHISFYSHLCPSLYLSDPPPVFNSFLAQFVWTSICKSLFLCLPVWTSAFAHLFVSVNLSNSLSGALLTNLSLLVCVLICSPDLVYTFSRLCLFVWPSVHRFWCLQVAFPHRETSNMFHCSLLAGFRNISSPRCDKMPQYLPEKLDDKLYRLNQIYCNMSIHPSATILTFQLMWCMLPAEWMVTHTRELWGQDCSSIAIYLHAFIESVPAE